MLLIFEKEKISQTLGIVRIFDLLVLEVSKKKFLTDLYFQIMILES